MAHKNSPHFVILLFFSVPVLDERLVCPKRLDVLAELACPNDERAKEPLAGGLLDDDILIDFVLSTLAWPCPCPCPCPCSLSCSFSLPFFFERITLSLLRRFLEPDPDQLCSSDP